MGVRREDSRESSPEYESADDGEEATLAAALRTRLPTGSVSPEKQGTPAPDGFGADFEDDVFREGKGKEVGMAENPNNCEIICMRVLHEYTNSSQIFDLQSEQKCSTAQNHSKQRITL